jgi:hypothetical protein
LLPIPSGARLPGAGFETNLNYFNMLSIGMGVALSKEA